MGDMPNLQVLDRVGTLGLALILWLITSRRYVHIEELKREIAAKERVEERLDRALNLGDRALGAGEKLVESAKR